MRALTSRLRFLVLAAAAFLVPQASADVPAIYAAGVGNATPMGQLYVAPSVASIHGVSTCVICDDFYATAHLGLPTGGANVTPYSGNLSVTRGGDEGLSNQAAWLVQRLMSAYTTGNKTLQGQTTFAIWGLFNPSVLEALGGPGNPNRIAATELINQSAGHSRQGFSNFPIYAPTNLINAPGIINPHAPQGFRGFRTPEGSVVAIWAVNLLVLAGIALYFRRRPFVH